MSSISACLIVQDEEDRLPGCLQSVHDVVDEIVVVDTGSSDDTSEVAKEYGAEIYHFEWTGHFGDAKNESFKHATSEWILRIDADERLSPELREHIRELVQTDEDIIYKFPSEDEILTCAGPEDGYIRLFKKGTFHYKPGATAEGEGDVTQTKVINGTERYEPYPIIHCQRRNHWLIKPTRILPRVKVDAELSPKELHSLYYYSLAVYGFSKEFFKWFVLKKGYRDGLLGFRFASMKGLFALLLNLFIALRPRNDEAWKEWQREDVGELLEELKD